MLRPAGRQNPALLKEVRPAIGVHHRAAGDMAQHGFRHLMRGIGSLGQPVAQAGPEAMRPGSISRRSISRAMVASLRPFMASVGMFSALCRGLPSSAPDAAACFRHRLSAVQRLVGCHGPFVPDRGEAITNIGLVDIRNRHLAQLWQIAKGEGAEPACCLASPCATPTCPEKAARCARAAFLIPIRRHSCRARWICRPTCEHMAPNFRFGIGEDDGHDRR